jgi:hypothetical protein
LTTAAVPVWLAGPSLVRGTSAIAMAATLGGSATPAMISGVREPADAAVSINFSDAARITATALTGSSGFGRVTNRPLAAPPRMFSPEVAAPFVGGFATFGIAPPAGHHESRFAPGIGDNGTVIPPDTDGAVGPNNLIVAINSGVYLQNRSC